MVYIYIILLDVYGNAFFYKAFIDDKQYDDLKLSLNSYIQSERNQKIYKNPDLYYNRGVVHAYLENYNEAYKDFEIANKIDINLKANELSENIFNLTNQTWKMIKNKCSYKNKKLSQILSTIPTNLKENISFNLASVDDLKIGDNNLTKLISAKIVQPISKNFEVPV